MTLDLFDPQTPEWWLEQEADGVFVLRRFASARAKNLLDSIAEIAGQASFRKMITPGGHAMSAAMTCAGPARLNYHGVLTLKAGDHPLTGPYRYNLTFRRAG